MHGKDGLGQRRTWMAGAGAAALTLGLVIAVGLPVSAANQATSRSAVTQPVNTWPESGYDAANADVSPDPDISTANASQLGVRWMAPSGTTEYSSPVVQWNAQLQETLVYQGNENGYLTAYDQATGQTVWSDSLGSAIRDTPLVEGNNVWVTDTFSPVYEKLNAATGAEECSVPLVSTNNGSATIGAGPNGATTLYIAVNDLGTSNGPVYAINEANCAVDWTYTSYNGNDAAGSWDFLSYADDANGTPVVLIGTADPDSSVYAVNAITGDKVWSFQTFPVSTTTDTDVGAGASITAPEVNGFADGVAYVPGKDGYLYALNLTTGALIWDYDFGAAYNGGPPYSRSTPAVVGDNVIFGGTMGVVALNATTGAVEWHWQGTASAGGQGEVVGAMAVVGPSGQQVVAVTNLSGYLDVLTVQTGALLYSYQVGSFSVCSVSDVDGNLLVSSSDGFLYDFDLGGANSGTPSTAVALPAPGSKVTNPDGNLTISGTASGGPIASVGVAVQEGGPSGMWWDAAAGTFTPGFFNNPATLATPGAATTTWSLQIPVPDAGGTYSVQAAAAGTDGLADPTADSPQPSPSQDAFSVAYLRSAPHFMTTDGSFVAPGSPVEVSGSGFGDGEEVAVSLAGTTLATVTAGSGGAFPAAGVVIPTSASTGEASLVATDQTTGDTSSTPVDISNEWPSAGDGPLHTGAEPNDDVLAAHVAPSGNTYLTQAWSYPSGGAIASSATVDKNVAYFGNNAGTVTALDVHHSIPLWTYSAGSAVDSTPLVTGNRVIFGTEAGAVVALSTATGAVDWDRSIPSAINSAPETAGGLVFVGSAGGVLYALKVATGAIAWQTTLSGPVQDSPAVDASTQEVVVGAGDTVVALNTATGANLWSQTTGGAVTAYPTIAGGEVYVGSGDGKVHEYAEATGAPGWTFTADSPITAGGATWLTKNFDFVVGSTDGTVYYLVAATGKVSRTYITTGAVVGVSTTTGFVVVSSASGLVHGYKYVGYPSWTYKSTAGFAAPAAVLNGIVYVTGLDQTIRAFTIPGRPVP